MKTEEFIKSWIQENPMQAVTITHAAIVSCCVDHDDDTGETCFNFELVPDLKDLGDRIAAAIRATSFSKDATTTVF
jgi:hypothetical protein